MDPRQPVRQSSPAPSLQTWFDFLSDLVISLAEPGGSDHITGHENSYSAARLVRPLSSPEQDRKTKQNTLYKSSDALVRKLQLVLHPCSTAATLSRNRGVKTCHQSSVQPWLHCSTYTTVVSTGAAPPGPITLAVLDQPQAPPLSFQ